jgi:ABC-2 type transport system ATP-binding protein
VTDLVLQAQGLTRRYGSRLAVDGLDLTVRRGEVIGLLGRNGAGKTTTIRMLTTVLSPTAGEFWVDGMPSSRPNEIRRRVGVLTESSGYPQQQSGVGYLTYFARLFGSAKDDARATALRLLAEVGLAERADSRIGTYSRGMRQRLGIARALVNDPAVVFLDEPTLGLDPVGQRQMLAMVRDIARERGATVVLSTHTIPEVEETCSSVLILDEGRLVMSGSVRQVIEAVALPRTARLHVPLASVSQAMSVISTIPWVRAELLVDGSDVIRIRQVDAATDEQRRDAPLGDVLAALVQAGVTVQSFEVESARLSDAFMMITQKRVRDDDSNA